MVDSLHHVVTEDILLVERLICPFIQIFDRTLFLLHRILVPACILVLSHVYKREPSVKQYRTDSIQNVLIWLHNLRQCLPLRYQSHIRRRRV